MEEKKGVTFNIETELLEKFQKISDAKRRSMSSIVNELIESYLKKEEEDNE